MKTPPTPPTPTNTFLDALPHLEDGRILTRADRMLREVIAQARATGKRGKLAVVLTIEPRGASTVLISADVVDKAPEEEKTRSIFFVGEGYELLREDPLQSNLPFAQQQGAAVAG